MKINAGTWNLSVQRLVKKRKALRLTQEELAARMGYHVNTLRSWEGCKVIPSAIGFLSWVAALEATVQVRL